MKYTGIVIADIHFGAFNAHTLKSELDNVFLSHLKTLKKINFIVIAGDYFDHKIYLNDRVSDYALSFMDSLINISKEYNCPIRIVYGTESHEVNQYNIFSMYENDPSLNFKIINTVTEEELLQDLHVLYIPEEYMSDKKEYYKEYFDNKEKYDYIFGHGVIQEVMTYTTKETETKKESSRKKVPRFTTAELLNMCKGQVYFGHYHISTNIADKVFYVGSFSRWIFGEDEPKGFYELTCDISKGKYTQKFIENTFAQKYTTYTYGYDNHVMDDETSLLEELNKRDKLIDAENSDHVRYIFNIPENHPNPEFIINILNERYKFNDSVKVKLVNGYVEKKRKINKEKLSSVMNEYPMIFDKSIKLEDKIIYFIKKRYEKDISLEDMKKYLYDDEKRE